MKKKMREKVFIESIEWSGFFESISIFILFYFVFLFDKFFFNNNDFFHFFFLVMGILFTKGFVYKFSAKIK